MGCIYTKQDKKCNTAFTYIRKKNHIDTIEYSGVKFESPIIQGNTSAIYFCDRDKMLIYNDDVSLLLWGRNGLVETSYTWMYRDEYCWIRDRIQTLNLARFNSTRLI